MAKMFPAKVPDSIRQDPARQAEVAVFDALENQLEATFDVFYSVEWNARVADRAPATDGEADFVVGHPNHGFLVLEVKGGVIAFDPEEDKWTSTSKSGYINRISDPFAQARKSCHGLLGRTKKLVSQSGSHRLFHAAVFPHCLVRDDELPGSTVPALVLDADDMDSLAVGIERAFKYWAGGAELRGPSYGEVLAAIRRIHNQPLHGYRNLSLDIAEHHLEFDRLTNQQLKVLDMVGLNRRMMVRGCAGSGKTFVAKRLATRRAASGEQVLVLCFNNLLGGLLEEELAGLENVVATNFHSLCERLGGRAGLPMPPSEGPGVGAYYSQLAECAFQAIPMLPDERFDTIIVDEAQDFELDWWIVIESLLRSEAASLTVFTDANQLLYGDSRGVPESLGPFMNLELTENVRNTQAIHREAVRFYLGPEIPTATGPEGVAPRWLEADTPEDAVSQLGATLKRLVVDEKVSPADIAVLTPKGATSTMLKAMDRVGKYRLVPFEGRQADEIGWSTIRKFKGLESPVVVVVELDDSVVQSSRMRELAYVGFTRARDYLVAIGSSTALEALRKP